MATFTQVSPDITFTHIIVRSEECTLMINTNPSVGKSRFARNTILIGTMIDCHLQIHRKTRARNWMALIDSKKCPFSKNYMDMVRAKLSFPTICLRKRHSQFLLSGADMKKMIRIQDYSKHNCSEKWFVRVNNEATLLLFIHWLQGTTQSMQSNSPQEQSHCSMRINMI